MSISGQELVAIGGVGVAVGAGSILLCQVFKAAAGIRSLTETTPWFVRLFRVPALLIAPVILPLLTTTQAGRINRALASVELESVLTPQSWIGMRIAHAWSFAAPCAIVSVVLGAPMLPVVIAGFCGGYSLGGLWMRKTRRALERRITRELPSYLDMLTVCVEAGATLTAGVNHIIEGAADSPLRRYFEHVLREVRGGQLRAHAFERVAGLYAVPSLSTLAAALGHAESSGMSLGGILRAQGQQRIAERFARAEQLAMQAPVKLLGPLILCIFPCTFVVLAVPIVVRLTEAFSS